MALSKSGSETYQKKIGLVGFDISITTRETGYPHGDEVLVHEEDGNITIENPSLERTSLRATGDAQRSLKPSRQR